MPLPRLAFIGPPRSSAPWLLQALARVGTLEAICDENAERELARYHARWAFSETAAMLKEAEPDGVVLEKPLAERPRLIKECLAGGASVLLTGMPGTAAACKRLHTVAKLAGRCVMATPAQRFAPAFLLARRLLDSGKFGAPLSMTLHSTRRGWSRAGASDDGPVPADQVFEAIDLTHHLLGVVHRVFAMPHDEGALVVSAMSAGNVPISIVLHANGPAEAVGVEIELRSTDGGRLLLDRQGQLVCGNGARVDAAHGVALAAVDPALELGYEGLVAQFGRYLSSAGRTSGLIGPVLAIAAASEAVFASAANAKPITIKDPQAAMSPPAPATP